MFLAVSSDWPGLNSLLLIAAQQSLWESEFSRGAAVRNGQKDVLPSVERKEMRTEDRALK